MIFFFDGNTVWRRKYAEALARRRGDTVIVSPRSRGMSRAASPDRREEDMPVWMPPGWAGRLSWASFPYLKARAERRAASRGQGLDAAFFTSPHYLPLARSLGRDTRIVYYCSDDYRSYAGWGGAGMVAQERELCRLAYRSVFVSEALRRRAVEEYGLDPDATLVSPNATEPRFAATGDDGRDLLAGLARPAFGAVGMFNDRIDIGFLDRLAQEPALGSLVLVGPLEGVVEQRPALERLLSRPKVKAFGRQPHEAIHRWMAALDVAVIPYRATPLNHFCSPMRLYDHLAVGHPIIATPHCAQIAERGDLIVADAETAGAAAGAAAERAERGRRPVMETWDDRVRVLAGCL
ncbi:MAG: glycosyltransferase [Alphaproteobacteria bacterium]|nr:glycosyltransferase [Alphaproteobacteria bacterium]